MNATDFRIKRGPAKVGVVENISRSRRSLVSTDALLATDTIEVTFSDPIRGHSDDVAAGRSGVAA